MKSTTISVEADRGYVDAFSTFARSQKVTMAHLVRQALDHAYGDALKPYLALFDAPDGASAVQLERASNSDASQEPTHAG